MQLILSKFIECHQNIVSKLHVRNEMLKKSLIHVFVGTVYWLNYHQKQQSAIAMMANAAKRNISAKIFWVKNVRKGFPAIKRKKKTCFLGDMEWEKYSI